jgi:5-methylcytosine-specific restriction endonuclease McrA
MTYSEKLKDPRWQRRRLELFNSKNWQCEYCNEHRAQLHAHHVHYIKGMPPWDYPDELIVVLCSDCHAEKHEFEEKLFSALAMKLRPVPGRRMEKVALHVMAAAMEEIQ